MADKNEDFNLFDDFETEDDEEDLSAKPIFSFKASKTMSIMKMGKMLGLHKTDSYWLAHKNFFKIITVAGKMRVDIESFEEWYKHQIKYKKIDGTPPGEALKEESYSAKDIAQMLQISEDIAYAAMKRDNVPYIVVDYWRRWTKEVFEEWYSSQSRYRTAEDKEKDLFDINRTLSMPEMRFLLGVHRNTVYDIINHPKNKNVFEFVIVATQKRITKDSFMSWYNNQNKYKMLYDSIEEAQQKKSGIIAENEPKPIQEEIEIQEKTEIPVDESRNQVLSVKSKNPDYYSIEEVAEILGKKRRTILKMIRANKIKAISVVGSYRILKLDFDRWLIEENEQKESEVDGNGNSD